MSIVPAVLVAILYCEAMWTHQLLSELRAELCETWADWDEELLSLELQELNAADFDLDLTGSIGIRRCR